MSGYKLTDGAPDAVLTAIAEEAEAIFNEPIINQAEALMLLTAVERAAETEPTIFNIVKHMVETTIGLFVDRACQELMPEDETKGHQVLRSFDWLDALNSVQ